MTWNYFLPHFAVLFFLTLNHDVSVPKSLFLMCFVNIYQAFDYRNILNRIVLRGFLKIQLAPWDITNLGSLEVSVYVGIAWLCCPQTAWIETNTFLDCFLHQSVHFLPSPLFHWVGCPIWVLIFCRRIMSHVVRPLFPVPLVALDSKPVGSDTKMCSSLCSLSFYIFWFLAHDIGDFPPSFELSTVLSRSW